MLEGIGIALRTHYDTANGAKNILENAVAQIKANYIGAMLAEKMNEVQAVYNNTMQESKDSNYNACIAILDQIQEQARKVVENPVSPDFSSTLDALKLLNNPTPKEIETVVGAYKNNYFAYRAICDFLGVIKPMTIDDIDEDIAYIKENLHACFYRDSIEGYHFMNWLSGHPYEDFDDIFRAFTEGRFEDISQHEQNPDGED